VKQVSRWPRAFPPSTPRALPSCSPTSCRSVLRARLTPRRTAAGYGIRLPARACGSPSICRPLRGLPVPVHETCMGLPNSLTPEGAVIPGPLYWKSCHGHPHGLTALAPSNDVVSRLDHPARPRALLRFASRVTLRGAKIGFPGVDSSWGRTCSIHHISCSPAFSCRFSTGAPDRTRIQVFDLAGESSIGVASLPQTQPWGGARSPSARRLGAATIVSTRPRSDVVCPSTRASAAVRSGTGAITGPKTSSREMRRMAIARGDGPKTSVDISEREVVVAILAHRGQPTEAPPIARARGRAIPRR
jgi:hypothetical protein